MKCHFFEYTHNYSIPKENKETPIWYNIINFRIGGVYMLEDFIIKCVKEYLKNNKK